MDQSGYSDGGTNHANDVAGQLARADAMRVNTAAIMRHLVLHTDPVLVSDAVVATVRGMMRHLATQFLSAHAMSERRSNADDQAAFSIDTLSEYLNADEPLLRHVHALAYEAYLTRQLGEAGIVDPVVSPLVEEAMASDDTDRVETAVAFLTAQARFLEQARRMELPIDQLPKLQLARACAIFTVFVDEDTDGDSAAAEQAAANLQNQCMNANSRLDVAAHLVAQNHVPMAIASSGLPLFLTALAQKIEQSREEALFACVKGQAVPLALILRAAGMAQGAIEAQLIALSIDPDSAEPAMTLNDDDAARMAGKRG